jgi:hypothetical protein
VLDLQAFLVADRLEVLDIVPGVVPGTRRLLVGDPGTARKTHQVALASNAAGRTALASEVRHLDELAIRLRAWDVRVAAWEAPRRARPRSTSG